MRVELKIGDRLYHRGMLNYFHGPFTVTNIKDHTATIENPDYTEKKQVHIVSFAGRFEQKDSGWCGDWVIETEEILNHKLQHEILDMLYNPSDYYEFEDLPLESLKEIKRILEESGVTKNDTKRN